MWCAVTFETKPSTAVAGGVRLGVCSVWLPDPATPIPGRGKNPIHVTGRCDLFIDARASRGELGLKGGNITRERLQERSAEQKGKATGDDLRWRKTLEGWLSPRAVLLHDSL